MKQATILKFIEKRELEINKFIDEDIEIIDIKYQVAISDFTEDQVYCFSALIMYRSK